MIPEKINIQINQLEEQAQIFSSSQRWMTVQNRRDEVEDIKDQITELNEEIIDVFEKIDNIILDALLPDFEIDSWFEEMKEKSVFTELNPKLVYDEKQLELERKRIIEEKKIKREIEENQNRIQAERILEFKKLCLSGPNDIQKLKEFINDGFDINQPGVYINVYTMIESGRSIDFIEFLVKNGLLVTKQDIVFYAKHNTLESKRLLSILLYARNIDIEAINEIGIINEREQKEKENKLFRLMMIISALIIGTILIIIFRKEIFEFLSFVVKLIAAIFLGFILLLGLPTILKNKRR